MTSEILTENKIYMLRPLCPNDKEDYMHTIIANTYMPKAYELPGYSDYVWQTTPLENEKIYCIYEKAPNTYCGFCNVRGTDTMTPEIGISILPEYQGKGIASQALQLMMTVYTTSHIIDFFIAKVDSRNHHSLRLMQKMGAIQFQVEDCELKQALDSLYESMDSDTLARLNKYEVTEEDGYICVFKINV